jgi:prepilin-type N-terminal cleavage/methylation domain-containing protein
MKKPRGFTLIELLIVIAVIAILATAVIIAVSPGDQFARARNTTRETHGRALEQAILIYKIKEGDFPTEIDTLLKEVCNTGSADTSHTVDCTNKADLSTLVEEGYIASIPEDPLRDSEDTGSGYFVAKSYDNGRLGVVQGLKEISCEEGYVGVPGNTMYHASDFCVMKYEAKDVSGVATSQADNTPWVSISPVNAKSECEAVDANLITNPQWMTIARNIEAQDENWTDGTVGSGQLFRGSTNGTWDPPDPGPLAASTDDDGYYGTGDTSGVQKRTHILSNGEVIWDFSGNVYNWVDYTTQGTNSQPQDPFNDGYSWQQINAVTDWGSTLSYDMFGSGNNTWTSSESIGRIYYDSTQENERAFGRGGYWSGGSYAGAFSLTLNYSPTNTVTRLGFRCSR